MQKIFSYGLLARYYGIFYQLPYSFLVTVIIVIPFSLLLTKDQLRLIPELTIYWTLLTMLAWLVKDIRMNALLHDVKLTQEGIEFLHNGCSAVQYKWADLYSIREYAGDRVKENPVSRNAGILLRFTSGDQMFVYDRITGYAELKKLLVVNC